MIGGICRVIPNINHSVIQAGGSVLASIHISNDGRLFGSGNGNVPWALWHRQFSDDMGANYWLRTTQVSGDVPDIGVFGTWQQMNTGRAFLYNKSSGTQTWTGTFTIEIASDSGGSTIVAASAVGGITLSATRT